MDNPPAPILMVGLQGSGKTTTSAKLANRFKQKDGKKVCEVSATLGRWKNKKYMKIWHTLSTMKLNPQKIYLNT